MKRLVLVGGGHSHVEVLRRLGERPAGGVETLLVDPARFALYSGMIPGVVAGDYDLSDCRIDLPALARFARTRWIEDRATGLDPDARRVALAGGEALDYDFVSLDVGSVTAGGADAAPRALAVRPIDRFVDAIDALCVRAASGAIARVAVVGAGAAGVELLLTLQHRLRGVAATPPAFTLVSDAPQVLTGHAGRARVLVERLLRERGVDVLAGRTVARVGEAGLEFSAGPPCAADAVVWATGAAAPDWLRATGLALDARGFIAVDRSLRSVSHPQVFAAGDCASIADDPQPKSGVTAVREGPVLAANLARALEGRALLRFSHRSGALALLNCGRRSAVASWGGAAFSGRWVWHWKDWIDLRFVARYAV